MTLAHVVAVRNTRSVMGLKFDIFEKYQRLNYGISSVNEDTVKIVADDKATIEKRDAYFASLGISKDKVVTPLLVGGSKVVVVDLKNGGDLLTDTDGLVTKETGLYLSIAVADCFPLYFYAPNDGVVALVHAGWKGVAGGIIEKTTDLMLNNFGLIGGDFLVGIGPGIRSCHFEIKDDVFNHFSKYNDSIIRRGSEVFVDLPRVILRKLTDKGVKVENIEDIEECSYCLADKYFSHRRDAVSRSRMITYIGIK